MVPPSSDPGREADGIVAPFRLRLLGSWSLEGPDGQQINSVLAQPKRLCLLAYLAFRAEPITRATIVALFWPERDEETARNNLAQALFYLRRSMGKSLVESLPGDRIQVSAESVWFDVRELLGGETTGPDGPLHFFAGWNADSSPPLQDWLDDVRRRVAEIEGRSDDGVARDDSDPGSGPTTLAPARSDRGSRPRMWLRWGAVAAAALLVLVSFSSVRNRFGDTRNGAASAAEPAAEAEVGRDAFRPSHLAVLRPRVNQPGADSTFVYAVLAELTHQLMDLISEPDSVVSLRYTDSPADLNQVLRNLGLESELQRAVEVVIAIGPDSISVNGMLLSGSGYVFVQETTSERYPTPAGGALSTGLPRAIARDIARGLAEHLSRR